MKLWQQIALGFLGFFALIVLVNEFEIAGLKFWGVRKENVRREIFEQTQSYVSGMRRELSDLRFQYEKETDSANKNIIKGRIIRDFAEFDDTKLSPEQLLFLQQMRGY